MHREQRSSPRRPFDPPDTPEELAVVDELQRIDAAEPFDAAALTDLEVRMWVDGPGQSPDRVAPAIRDAVYAMDLPLNDPGRVGGRAIALDPPANDRLAQLRCPVLAIAGTLDFSEVVQVARRLEAEAPDARAFVWPDVAHMIGMEAPDRLADAIVEFLAPLDGWA